MVIVRRRIRVDACNLLLRILQSGHGGDKRILREELKWLRDDTPSSRAAALLACAVRKDSSIFQMVLDAMSKNMILPTDLWQKSALEYALKAHKKEAVLAVVERMRSESAYELSAGLLHSLFTSCLFNDQEVVDAVVSVVPPATFAPSPALGDCLYIAIRCNPAFRKRAIDFCMKYGPSMEERLEMLQGPRFIYLICAAQSGDLETVRMIHDFMPLLPGESRKRGEVEEYVRLLSVAYRPTIALMEYLVEEGGEEVLTSSYPGLLCHLQHKEDVKWLLARAPHLLEEACRVPERLNLMFEQPATVTYLTEQIVELVEPKFVVSIMQGWMVGSSTCRAKVAGWMSMLKALHKGVPECMDGLRWPWLMHAVKRRDLEDVKYMAGMCSREHLVMRDEKGRTAYDVAVEKQLPEDLLCYLKVAAAKGAHA